MKNVISMTISLFALTVFCGFTAEAQTPTSAKSIIEGLLPKADCQPEQENQTINENGLTTLPELDLGELSQNDCSRGISIRKVTTPIAIDLTVEFDHDSSQITAFGREQLDQLAVAFSSKELDAYDFKLVGHTDASGSASYNQQLSIRRVESVKRYLVDAHKLEQTRFSLEGKGETQLKTINAPYAAQNRRVEVINLGAKR